MSAIGQYEKSLQSFTPDTTTYLSIGNGNMSESLDNENITRSAGTYSNLSVNIPTSTLASTISFRFRKNGANGNQVITVTGGASGYFTDASNTDSVVSGDKINYSAVGGAGSGGQSCTVDQLNTLFKSTTNSVSKFHTGAYTITTASSTSFGNIGQTGTPNTDELLSQATTKTIATLKNMCISVTSNTRSTNTTINTRINGVDGNLTLTIAGAATGFFEDSSNTDNIISGDLINYKHVTGTGSGTLSIRTCLLDFETTNNQTNYSSGRTGASAIAINVVTWMPFASNGTNITLESIANIKSLTTFIASKFNCNIRLNSVTATTILVFRKNGINRNQTISVPASTTGYFEDAVNEDMVFVGDNYNCQVSTGASGTSITINNIGILANMAYHKLNLLGIGN